MAVVASAKEGMLAAGRATVLQLRASYLSARELEREALALVGTSPVPVVISSRCDVVLEFQAAGVNLPERDISVSDARKILGWRLIGRSVHSVEAALIAEGDGADFVIFGPVWSSASHPEGETAGVEGLSRVAHSVRIPVLAIGGVTQDLSLIHI